MAAAAAAMAAAVAAVAMAAAAIVRGPSRTNLPSDAAPGRNRTPPRRAASSAAGLGARTWWSRTFPSRGVQGSATAVPVATVATGAGRRAPQLLPQLLRLTTIHPLPPPMLPPWLLRRQRRRRRRRRQLRCVNPHIPRRTTVDGLNHLRCSRRHERSARTRAAAVGSARTESAPSSPLPAHHTACTGRRPDHSPHSLPRSPHSPHSGRRPSSCRRRGSSLGRSRRPGAPARLGKAC